MVFQGNITHGGQGRENPESFWHKLSQILLNMKNITCASFNMSSAWSRGYGEGNMPNRQDYHSGDPGSALHANLLVRVCSYIPCFPGWVQTTTFCSRQMLPNTCSYLISGSFSGYRSWVKPSDTTKKADQKCGWGLFGGGGVLGVCATEMGSQLISLLGDPPRWCAIAEVREDCQGERPKALPGGSIVLPFARPPAPAVSQQSGASACPCCLSWEAPRHPPVQERTQGAPGFAASPRLRCLPPPRAETATLWLHNTAGCKITVKFSHHVSHLRGIAP